METIFTLIVAVLSVAIFAIVIDFIAWTIVPAAWAVRRTRKESVPDDWFNLIQ